MNANTEILRLAELVLRINELKSEQSLHVSIQQGLVSVAFFNRNHEIGRHEHFYSSDQGYLPRLRKMRHDIEQFEQEVLEQRRESAA